MPGNLKFMKGGKGKFTECMLYPDTGFPVLHMLA